MIPRRVPWRRNELADPDRRYVLFAGTFVLDRWRTLPKFMALSIKGRRAARRTPGLVGFAMTAWFPKRSFTAIGAFADEEAMRRFVASPGHAAAMSGSRAHLGPGSRFVRWECYGSELPPRAIDVARRLEAVPGLGELDGPEGEPVAGGGSHHAA